MICRVFGMLENLRGVGVLRVTDAVECILALVGSHAAIWLSYLANCPIIMNALPAARQVAGFNFVLIEVLLSRRQRVPWTDALFCLLSIL